MINIKNCTINCGKDTYNTLILWQIFFVDIVIKNTKLTKNHYTKKDAYLSGGSKHVQNVVDMFSTAVKHNHKVKRDNLKLFKNCKFFALVVI